MPKSKFRPDPNVVQSGYYNDRNGTQDRSIHVDGAMHKSAAQETRASTIDAIQQNPMAALTNPKLMMKALANGGKLSQQDMESLVDAGSNEGGPQDVTLLQRSGKTDNPYINKAVVQSGWFGKEEHVQKSSAAVADEEGHIDFDVLQAEMLSDADNMEKGDNGRCWDGYEPVPGKEPYSEGSCRPAKKSEDDEEDEVFEDDDQPEELEVAMDSVHEGERGHMRQGKKVAKHYGPASEDSTHAEVHNESGHTGLDSPADAESWATQSVYTKSYGLNEMEEWLQKSAVRPEVPEETAASILSEFLGEPMEKATPVGGTTPGGYKKVAPGKYEKVGGSQKPDGKKDQVPEGMKAEYGVKEAKRRGYNSVRLSGSSAMMDLMDGKRMKKELESKGITLKMTPKGSGKVMTSGAKLGEAMRDLDHAYEKDRKADSKDNKRRAEAIGQPDLEDEIGQSGPSKKEKAMKKGFSGHDPAGKGGMPEAGDAPSSLPASQRPVDGGEAGFRKKAPGPHDGGPETAGSTAGAALAQGNLYEGQDKDYPVGFADIEFDDADADLQAMAGGTSIGGLGRTMSKGVFLDSADALEKSHQLRSMAKAILDNQDTDIEFGVGIAPEVSAEAEFEDEAEEFGKGMVFHSDATDRRIEKAFSKHGDGSTVFAQTSVPGMDLRSGAVRGKECGACGTMMKSYLTQCETCGTNHAQPIRQGVTYSPELQKALAGPGRPEDVTDIVLDD